MNDFDIDIAAALLDEATVYLLALVFGTLRILPLLIIFPGFSMASITTGYLRVGVTLIVSIFMLPLIVDSIRPIADDFARLLVLSAKELAIGIVMALVASAPIWIAFSAGALIDTQSGEQLGGMIDPATGEDTSSGAQYWQNLAFGLGLHAGIFSGLFHEVYPLSLQLWPLESLAPASGGFDYGGLSQILSIILLNAVLLASPFMFGLFIIDFGLGLLARFVPSVSPFFISLGAKVSFVFLFLLVFHVYLTEYLVELYFTVSALVFGA